MQVERATDSVACRKGQERSRGVIVELRPPQPSFRPGRRSIALVQLHLAPCMPPLIQSIDLTPGGGLTHSAGKYWMSTRSTRFASGLYLVRLIAIGWVAWGPSASFILMRPPGDCHSSSLI